MSYIIEKSYVFVILEHITSYPDYHTIQDVQVDAKLHGVYTTRKAAESKVRQLRLPGSGYFSILKNPVKGQFN